MIGLGTPAQSDGQALPSPERMDFGVLATLKVGVRLRSTAQILFGHMERQQPGRTGARESAP